MRNFLSKFFICIASLTLLFLVRKAVLGNLSGTFRSHAVDQDYVKLQEFLVSQKGFSRTFWIPTTERFGFSSVVHPAMSAYGFFNVTSPDDVIHAIEKKTTEAVLQAAGVKYVVIPYDSEGEIFLKDRKYDDSVYKKTISDVQNISWLREIGGFGKIHVFEVLHPKDLFWLSNGSGGVSYALISPTQYRVTLKNVKKGQKLVFLESFDKNWITELQRMQVASIQYNALFNSFVLPESGSYVTNVSYAPQWWVFLGGAISITTLIATIALFLLIFLKK